MNQQLRKAGRLSASAAVLVLGIAVVAPDASAQSGRSRTSERTERSSTGRTSSARSAPKASTKASDSSKRGAVAKPTAAKKATAGRQTTASSSRTTATKRSTAGQTVRKAPATQAADRQAADRQATGRQATGRQATGRQAASRPETAKPAPRSPNSGRSDVGKRAGSTPAKASGSRTVTRASNGGRADSGVAEKNRRNRADANRRTTAADRTRTGSRPVRDNVRRAPAVLPNYSNHYGRAHRVEYGWCNQRHHPGHYHYASSRIHISSHLYIGVRWPWRIRFEARWRPRYRYRQVVYVESGWGSKRYSQKVDVRTTYRQRVLRANDQYAEIEIEIDGIEVYQGGQYLGFVDRIPSKLSKIRATVYEDGFIEFDRNVHLVGDMYRGFELLSTRYYDDHLLNAYRYDHDVRVGKVDLRRGRVQSIRRSRLFSPVSFNGLVPISLLPDDDRLWDYGRDVISDNFDVYGDRRNGDDWRTELNRSDEIRYNTDGGVAIDYSRETQLERIN